MAATSSLGNRPDRAEAAAKEDEANTNNTVEATGLKQQLEGICNLDNNALHLSDVFHALHEVGQVKYLTLDTILGGVFFELPNRTLHRIIFSEVMEKGRLAESTVSSYSGGYIDDI